MGWEIFARTMVTTSDPMVTLMQSGRMSLNKGATKRLEERAIERVLLLWDPQTRQVGIKPITKKDTRSYKVSYSGRGNSAGLSTVMFYKFINYNWDKTQNYPATWNEDEGMYVFTIPADRLTGNNLRTRRNAAPKTGAKTAKLLTKQKEATHLTQ